MSPTQKPNLCAEIKQAHDQLLSEKQKFDALMTEINSLRPNFSKNIPVIKSKISDMQSFRTQIEEKITTLIFTFGNNTDRARALVKKYAPRLLSRIEKKTASNQDLSLIELTLLYDIKDKIISILSEKQQQKVKEIRDMRDKKADASQVLELKPEEIAWDETKVNQNTKAYIGPIFPTIFTKLNQFYHIYTDFPEGKIRKHDLEIGSSTKNQLIQELNAKNIKITHWGNGLLNLYKFTTSSKIKDVELVQLSLKSLGFPNGANYEQIYQKAEELGLDLCPAEVGPRLRLQYSGKERLHIAMKQIIDSDGVPWVFCLSSGFGLLGLTADMAKPNSYWRSDNRWVFSLRKLDS